MTYDSYIGEMIVHSYIILYNRSMIVKYVHNN